MSPKTTPVLKICITLALPALVYGWGTWAIREQDVRGNEICEENTKIQVEKLHKDNEYILSELKINPVLEKIQNYRNKWVQHVRRMDRDRHSAPCG